MNLVQEQVFISSYLQGHITREEFLRQYKRLIYFYICKKKVQPDNIEDCFQDCVIEMYRSVPLYDFNKKVKFTTFLLSQLKGVITRYKRDYFYWHKFHPSLDELQEETGFEPEAVIEEVHEFAGKLKEAIDCLDEREKKIIIMHYFSDLEFKEIAHLLHIPKGSMTHIHNRALLKMKNVLLYSDELERI